MRVKVKEKALVLLACLFVCSRFAESQGFVFSNPITKLYAGTISPLDPDICLTQNITFTCTLLSSPELNYSIGFAVKNESTNREYLAVDRNRVISVNETVSEFTIYDVNVTSSFRIYMRCYYWLTHGDTDATLQLGETSTASVYQMPKKIENINCIVTNYIETMNCSWDYGIEYIRMKPTVRFQWRIPSYSKTWNNCTDLNVEYGYCFWKGSDSGDFTMKNIEINITLEEVCGVEITSLFHVDTRKIVKPDPVVDLKATVINSTCIDISWRTNNSQMNYPKEHRIMMSSLWGDNKEVKFNTTIATENRTHVRRFSGLHPDTDYTFVVSIKPTGDQDGFYSETRKTVARTYSDIPSASPEVTDGGYKWNQRDCEGTNNLRQVCPFWKPIREEDKNGPMKGLRVTYTSSTDENTPIEKEWAEDLTYSCSYLLCDSSYMLTIKARNVNGTSENGSVLEISSAKSGILKPEFIVEADNDSNVFVTWKYSEDLDIDKFLVVWCRNRNGDCEIYSVVDWRYFDASLREAVITFNSSSPAQDFLYGVGAITQHGSSGVELQDCVYLKHGVPQRRPQNVVVSTGPESNTLVVTWDKLACSSAEPYIAMYDIQFKKLSDSTYKSRNISASSEARVVLPNLDEGRTYLVTVSGISKDGHYGPESHSKTGIPKNNELKTGTIVGISMGTLIPVIIAGVVGCILFRKCKRFTKKRHKEITAITIPDPDFQLLEADAMNDMTTDRASIRSVERQNSDDSGFDPMTPQPGQQLDPLKFAKKEQFMLPDGYVRATAVDGHVDNTGSDTLINLTAENTDIFIVPHELRNARIGMVLNDHNTFETANDETSVKREINDETFVKGKADDETPVKGRAKTISGDSGVSEGYSRAIIGNTADHGDYENGIESTVCKHATTENTNVSNNIHSKPENGIPQPRAFSEDSNDFTFSDRGHITSVETGTGSKPDYSKAKMVGLSDSTIQTKTNKFPTSNLESEPKSQESTNIPSLTTIPHPVIGENQQLDIEEDNVFPLEQLEPSQSCLMTDSSNASEYQCDDPSNYVHAGLNNIQAPSINNLVQSDTDYQPNSDYVTNFPHSSIDCTTMSSLATDIWQAQPSPGVSSFCPPANKTRNNSSVSSGYVSTVASPAGDVSNPIPPRSVSGDFTSDYLPHTGEAQDSVHINTVPKTIVPNSNKNSLTAQGYVPHSNASPDHTFTFATERSNSLTTCDARYNPSTTISDGYLPNSSRVSTSELPDGESRNSPTSGSGSLPGTYSVYTSGYVTSPDLVTTSSSQSEGGENTEPKHIFSFEHEVGNQSTGTEYEIDSAYIDQSQIANLSPPPPTDDITVDQHMVQPENTTGTRNDHRGYVDETLAKVPLGENEEPTNIHETSEQSLGTGTDEMPREIEQVSLDSLSHGLNSNEMSSNDREPVSIELADVSVLEEDAVDDDHSNRDSDSGLSSLEHGSPETERRIEDIKNGYVPHTLASMHL